MGSEPPLDRSQHFARQVPQPPVGTAHSRHPSRVWSTLCSVTKADIDDRTQHSNHEGLNPLWRVSYLETEMQSDSCGLDYTSGVEAIEDMLFHLGCVSWAVSGQNCTLL